MEIHEIAKEIATTTANMDHTKFGYYMTNINHPVIATLKSRYCASKKINGHIPMSDQERIEFELWLFQPSVRKMVEQMVSTKK